MILMYIKIYSDPYLIPNTDPDPNPNPNINADPNPNSDLDPYSNRNINTVITLKKYSKGLVS